MKKILLVMLFVLISCKNPEDIEFNIEDPIVPALKVNEICLQGIVYYVGYYVHKNGEVEGGPMTPKYIQDNLFPVRCENNGP